MSYKCHLQRKKNDHSDYSYRKSRLMSRQLFFHFLFLNSYLMLTFDYIRFDQLERIHLENGRQYVYFRLNYRRSTSLPAYDQKENDHYCSTVYNMFTWPWSSFQMSDQTKKKFIHASHVQNCHTRYVIIIIQLTDHCTRL